MAPGHSGARYESKFCAGRPRVIFGIFTLVLSAFFFYMVNIVVFVNQLPWHTKAIGSAATAARWELAEESLTMDGYG